ncbi:alpha/beta fold hydrolase [Conexibacter sp. SYSU D00693]|uniref:alpha/beta fold hydrolase n=1 Tax=Conexibacter sp. SYSU D00693 TaxID=2812560 RepID=UPI00196AE5CC|nr:alpha/beta fold hydrolase [Conexibacter sp. SYSU D00693]
MASDGVVREVRSADGTALSVEVLGEGPPLLAVHGDGTAREAWGGVAPALADRFALHLVERRADATLAREVEDLAAVARDAGPPVRVVAHGHGAFVVLQLLRREPDLVERAVLLEPTLETPELRDPEQGIEELGDVTSMVQVLVGAHAPQAVKDAAHVTAAEMSTAEMLELTGLGARAFETDPDAFAVYVLDALS